MKGYKLMSEMTREEEKFFEKVFDAIYKKTGNRFTAKDISIEKIKCPECGKEAFCVHIHSIVNGIRHPDLTVDVDDWIEICPECGSFEKSGSEAYETNPEFRMTKCPFCGRISDNAFLKVRNRTQY